MIRFQCKKCGHGVSVKDDFAGRKARCPKCQSIGQIPLKTPQSSFPSDNSAGARIESADNVDQIRNPIHVATVTSRPEPSPLYDLKEATKACPYCKGEIPEEAKKCKHCGEWIVLPTTSHCNYTEDPETIKKWWNVDVGPALRVIGTLFIIFCVFYYLNHTPAPKPPKPPDFPSYSTAATAIECWAAACWATNNNVNVDGVNAQATNIKFSRVNETTCSATADVWVKGNGINARVIWKGILYWDGLWKARHNSNNNEGFSPFPNAPVLPDI